MKYPMTAEPHGEYRSSAKTNNNKTLRARIKKKYFAEICITRVVVFFIFVIYAFSLIYALLWGFLSSLKTHVEFMTSPNSLPKEWLFGNYIRAFDLLTASGNSLGSMFFNSIWLTIFSSLISVAVSASAAYVCARYRFVGRRMIMAIQYGVLMIPLYTSSSAGYKLIMDLNLYDSPLYLIKSASALGNIFLILMTFFSTLPDGFAESAEIDGAGHTRIFLQIMLPMAMPSIMSIFLLCFITGWNDYMTPIMYLPSYPTLASGLYVYESVSKFNMDKPVYFAGVMMCAMIPLVIFGIFRDKFMTNVTIGGLKG